MIGILIPVYNNLEGLIKTLNSISESSLLPDLVLIIDDGSEKSITLFGHQENIQIIRSEKNLGLIKSLNIGANFLLKKNFEYIVRVDAGDTYHKDKLRLQVNYMNENSDVCLLGTNANAVGVNGKYLYDITLPTQHEEIVKFMHINNAFLHPSVIIRARIFNEIELYSEKYLYAEDYELFFRICKKYRVHNLPHKLLNYEINPDGISLSKKKVQVFTRLRIQYKNFNASLYQSYYGLIRSLITWLIPVKIVTFKKSLNRYFTKK